MRIARAAVAAVLLAGCATGPEPASHLEAVFDRPEVATARERVPDLVAAAERARARSVRAAEGGDDEAAQDHATHSRLLLSAAVTESERIALEERRLEAERRARELEARARAAEAARQEVVHETRRLLAARVARGQAARAFEAAESVERRRGIGTDASRQRRAAEVLRERARLLLAAARALGASDDAGAAAEDHLTASREARRPSDALARAEEAVLAALRALGTARARADGPSPAEVRSLWQMAGEMGLALERTDRGTLLRPSGRRWSKSAVQRLASLLEAHPHGPVRVEGLARAAEGPAARRARARARALQRRLARAGIAEDRLTPGVAAVPSPPADAQVLLVAYVP